MLHVRLDSKDINRILGNTVSFSYGFLQGTEIEQIFFNQQLGEYTVDALNKYIDSQARIDPKSLHHVYEWDQTGDESGRLFLLKSKASKRVIHFYGKFLPSKTISGPYSDPFVNKAEIMENGISITVAPRDSDFLAFEDEGQLVFTRSAVHIEHPGGDQVAGSFGKVVDEFFLTYYTNAFIAPLIADLSRADEFTRAFPQGAQGGGRSAGIRAGKKYLSVKSLGVIE